MKLLITLIACASLAGCDKKPAPAPEPAKPEAAKPEAAKPEPAKPEAAKPEPAKPEAAKPEPVQPEVAKPEPAQPEAAKPEVAPAAPEDVAKRYLELGAAGGDLAKARELVLPQCQGTKIWEVDAAVMMGTRLTADSVTVDHLAIDGSKASVDATIKGSAKASNTKTQTEIAGKKVSIDIGNVSIGSASMTTTLHLEKSADGWRIACP